MSDFIANWLSVDPSEFDTLRLALSHDYGDLIPYSIAVLLLITVTFGFFGSRQLPLRRRLLLTSLRIVGLGALFLILVQPELRLLKTARTRTHASIVVDASRSMTVEDAPDGESRWAQGFQFAQELAQELEDRLPETVIHILTFDEAVATAPAPGETPARWGRRTDMAASLTSLGERFQGERLSAVVMVSDGADHGGLRRQLKGAETPPALDRLEDVPVYTALAGDPERFRDVSVADLSVESFGFVHNPVEVEAEIDVLGFPGKTVTVTLSSDTGVVATRTVKASGSEFRKSVKFSFTPHRTGTYVYSVKVPQYSGEAV
jgi:hypothetical protein